MLVSGDDDEAAKSADCAREDKSTNSYLLYVDSGVFRGLFTLSDNGNLVAVLGVLEVDVHQYCEDCDYNNVEREVVSEQLREPAYLRTHVDGAERRRLSSPDIGVIRNELYCDVVHHKGEKRLVGVPVSLEECRYKAPNRAGYNACEEHREEKKGCGQLSAEVHHADSRSKSAH